MAIVLYDYWRSSSAYRLRIALNLMGWSYERRPVNLVAGEQAAPEHLARNPQGLVPVLDIDGVRMTQSLAIIEYLDEAHGAAFLPREPLRRARVRALAYAVAMEMQPVCNLKVARHAVDAGGSMTMEGWMRHFIGQGFDALETMLRNEPLAPFIGGDRPGLADICITPQAYNAERWGVDLAPYPRISGIAGAMAMLPEVAAAHPDRVAPGG